MATYFSDKSTIYRVEQLTNDLRSRISFIEDGIIGFKFDTYEDLPNAITMSNATESDWQKAIQEHDAKWKKFKNEVK